MSPFEMAGLTVFILVLFLGIFLSVIGLPGTILIVFDVVAYALATGFAQVGFKVILILAAMALVAELLDFGLEMAGAARFGSSPRGVWAALIGSLAGAIFLTPVFLGLGSLIGILLGGIVTVLAVEMLERRKLKPAFRASLGAVLGRTAGLAAKGLLSVAMATIALYHIYS